MINDHFQAMQELKEKFDREMSMLTIKIKDSIVETIKDVAKKNGNNELSSPILKVKVSFDNISDCSSGMIDVGYWVLLEPKEKFGQEKYKFFHAGFYSYKNEGAMTGEINDIMTKMIDQVDTVVKDQLVANAIFENIGYIFVDLTK